MKLAKTDETGHSKVTKWLQDGCTLTAPQAAAVELVALGQNDTDAAKAAGVSRQSVNQWRNHDPAFIAAVNARRRELWEATHNRLRGLAAKALDVLAGALDADPATALPAAVQVLKCLKVYGEVGAPEGPTTAEAVLAQQAEAAARLELAGRVTTGDPLQSFMAESDEVPRLAQEHLDRLKAEWAARKVGKIA